GHEAIFNLSEVPQDRRAGRRMIHPDFCTFQPFLEIGIVFAQIVEETRQVSRFLQAKMSRKTCGQLSYCLQMNLQPLPVAFISRLSGMSEIGHSAILGLAL